METTEGYELLALGAVLLVGVVYATLRLLRSYRLRRLRELRGEAAAPEVASDRAYNRLALARREADVLAAQGADVDAARQLIELASRSLESRSFDRAFQLAQSAHETLVKARQSPTLPHSARTPATTGPSGPPSSGRGAEAPLAARAPAVGPTPSPQVARGRAEAQFQLRLFEEDLARATKTDAEAAGLSGARELYVQGHAAFARGDFAEAFRLALRGRRLVGGHLETLGPSGPAAAPSAAPGAPIDPARSAEEAASLDRCPLCGYPTVASDAYCRGCGAARSSAACPRCGAARAATDAFCGKCGERYT